jgi:mitochondrial cardiolipin hydrolase
LSANKSLACAALLLGLGVRAAFASHVYFSSDQDVERPIVQAIDHTSGSIQAALFEINSAPLIDALRRAAGRGVHVRLLLQHDGKSASSDTPTHDFLSYFEVRWSGGRLPHGIMHHKFAVFDSDTVVTGSYNWTRGARRANYENALFEDDADVVKAYMQQFQMLWSKGREAGAGDAAENTLIRQSTQRHSGRHRRKRRHNFKNRIVA